MFNRLFMYTITRKTIQKKLVKTHPGYQNVDLKNMYQDNEVV